MPVLVVTALFSPAFFQQAAHGGDGIVNEVADVRIDIIPPHMRGDLLFL